MPVPPLSRAETLTLSANTPPASIARSSEAEVAEGSRRALLARARDAKSFGVPQETRGTVPFDGVLDSGRR